MSDDNAIVSCVTLTGAEYVTMLAEAQQLKKDNERLRAALWDIHAVCNNGPFVWAKRVKTIARAALEAAHDR